jgi:methionine-rich copper-binding protein CopC
MNRKTCRRYRVALVIVAAALAGVAVLEAHMKFVKAMPEADSTVAAVPTQIQVWFSQKPDAKVSKLELTGPSGPVKLDHFHVMDADMSMMATVAGDMADGDFSVAWQAAGDDGHIQKGTYTFTLKRDTE